METAHERLASKVFKSIFSMYYAAIYLHIRQSLLGDIFFVVVVAILTATILGIEFVDTTIFVDPSKQPFICFGYFTPRYY